MCITLKDIEGTVTGVTFAGSSAGTPSDADDEKDSTWSVQVPSDVRLGTVQVKVTVDVDMVDDDTDLTGNITIGSNTLAVSPETAVQRQQITIQGSGFMGGGTGTSSVTVDGSSEGIDQEFDVDSGGNITLSVSVPDDAEAGSVTVMVTDGHGAVGKGTLMIPSPSITVSPTESLIGSDITVTGSGFSANDVVQISYDDNVRAVGTTNAVGELEATTFSVPSDAGIGTTHDVTAKTQINEDDADDADAEHTTPDAVISFSPTSVEAGGHITVSGMNFRGFEGVSELTIKGLSVLPVPPPTTDAGGSFEASNVQVPQLDPGTYTLVLGLSEKTITEFITIVAETAAPVTDPADVFAGLGDRLERVWYLDRATQSWSFYDPDAELFANVPDDRKLTSVASAQVVQIIISDGDPVEFQGMNLYAGTNPISLR